MKEAVQIVVNEIDTLERRVRAFSEFSSEPLVTPEILDVNALVTERVSLLPVPYQDVLDFAYHSGWRKREILDLRWDEVDELGGVVRLSPARSNTRVGTRVADLGADCGGPVAPTEKPSSRGVTGLHAGRHDRAVLAPCLASGVSTGGGAGPPPP